MKTISIMEQYFNLIKQGLKTVEGRVATPKYLDLQLGEVVKFVDNQNPAHTMLCEVTSCEHFADFRSMLNTIGLDKMLPGVSDIETGVGIYNGIPGYQEQVKQHGVLAIGIKVLDTSYEEADEK